MAISSTSIQHTPQANDDRGSYTEDQETALLLDVMGNDLGGKAKTLYSLDDGSSVTDLLGADTARAESTTADRSKLGAKIWITSEGKVGYRMDAGALDYLAAGQIVEDSFTYAIRLGNGTLAWATVTVTITGTNDGPDIFLAAGDRAAAALDEGDGALSASGTLSVVDRDVSDRVDVAVTGIAVGGSYSGPRPDEAALQAMLTLSGNAAMAADPGSTANLGWAFASGSAFDFLAAGETLVLTYTLSASDGHGGSDSQAITITLTGTNDAPTLDVGSGDRDCAALDEGDGGLAVAGTLTAFDRDRSDEVTASKGGVAVSGTGSAGGLSEADLLAMFAVGADPIAADGEAANVHWSFDSAGAAFDHLAAGQTLVLTYSVLVSDGHGASDSLPVTITITGTNDAPVADDATAALAEDSQASGQLTSSDPDDGASAHYALVGAAPAGFALADDGGWTFDAANAAYQHLAAGASMDVTIAFTVSDEHGASDEGQLVVTVTGANDAPMLVQALADREGSEDTPVSFTLPADSFADIDDGALLTYSASLADGSPLPSWLSFDAVTRSFAGTPPPDWSGTIALKVTASDGLAEASDGFDLVIAPVNDAPVITSNGGGASAALVVAENTTAVTTVTASDVDSASLSYSIAGGADAALFEIDSVSGQLRFRAAPDYEAPLDSGGDNIYDVVVAVSDGAAVDQQALSVTVGNVVEAPTASIGAIRFDPNEQAGNSLNLGGFVADGVVGGPVLFDAVVTNSSGQVVTSVDVLADGSLSITGSPNDSFTVAVTVTAADGVTVLGTASYALWIDGNSAGSRTFTLAGNNIGAGQGGADSLTGSSGADYLFGGSNGDKLAGLGGNDFFSTGGGSDVVRLSAPAGNGHDTIADHTNGTDRIMLAQGGGGWNAAGTTPTTLDGVALSGGDYAQLSDLASLTGANNKVAEILTAQSTATITGVTVAGAINAYVLVFNSTTQRGEIWHDGNWSDTDGRSLLVTLDDHRTLASVTGMSAADFGEYSVI